MTNAFPQGSFASQSRKRAKKEIMNKNDRCTHDPISQQRRAAPLDFFCDFLQGTWMDNTPEEALALWKLKVNQPTSYAADALYALDYVIAKPPHDFTRRLQQNGWIYLSHEDEPDEPLYTFDEHLQWLKNMSQQYGQLYQATIHGGKSLLSR